jgi:hypothetical protein
MALLTFTGVMLPSWSSGRASGNDKDHGGTAGLLEIHVFVFNRPLAFERLWRSLSAAKPTQHLRTEVVIHQVTRGVPRIQRLLCQYFPSLFWTKKKKKKDYDPKEEADWRRQRALLLPLAGTASSHGHVRVAFGFAQRGLKATMFEAWSPQGGSSKPCATDNTHITQHAGPLTSRAQDPRTLRFFSKTMWSCPSISSSTASE